MYSNIIKNIGTIIIGTAAIVLGMIFVGILIKFKHKTFAKKIIDSLK